MCHFSHINDMRDIYIYNTLSRKKELFKPITEGYLFRALGYKVRYVRNITDVGHLENDSDSGEDKIAKKARIEQLEPMEVVQEYTIRYHDAMRKLNVAPPSIEPRASGHIIEQIALVQKILDAGYAYISNGSAGTECFQAGYLTK